MRCPTTCLAGVLALLLGSGVAQAQSAAMHDIPWYAAHPAERNAILKFCQSSHAYSRNLDCLNAETGGTRAWGEDSARRAGLRGGPFDDLTNPRYWADNGLSRIAALASCRHPPTVYAPSTCAAAQQGEAIAAARRTGR